MKRLKWWILGFVALVIVALVVVFFSLDGLVRAGAEKALTSSLETESKVGGASISPFAGKFALSEISIANPEGYREPTAFTVGRIGLDVELLSFLGSEAHIREIAIDAPSVVIEQMGGTTNLGQLLKRLEKKGGGEPKAPPEGKPPVEEKPKGEGKTFRVDRVWLGGTHVRVLSDYLPSGPVDIKLADIEITDIGGKENRPVQAARILHAILQAILRSAVESGIDLPKELRALMNSDLEQLKAKVGERLNQEMEGLKEKGAKALEGLLPGKEKEKE